MMFRLVTIVVCLTLAHESRADGGYEEGGGYEAPPPKTKFNIGFNLPAMSISLPKLELPQISIKASVKNKKPFTLKMPVIKFNAHASTEDDNEYGGGYGQPPAPAYGEGDGGAGGYAAGPTAYASSPNGVSGYASSVPEVPAYAAAAANPKVGYERPASGQYNDQSAQQPAYQQPSYGQAGEQQHQAAVNAYASGQTYSRPATQQPQQQQSYLIQNQGYSSQPQPFVPQHNYQPQPQMTYLASNKQSLSPIHHESSHAMTSNGYPVPRPVQQANQVPEYRDENVKYYNSAPLYQQSQPSAGSAPLIQEFYGSRLRPSGYGRRSGRPYVEHMGGVFLASASDAGGPIFLTPFNENMESMHWHPLMRH